MSKNNVQFKVVKWKELSKSFSHEGKPSRDRLSVTSALKTSMSSDVTIGKTIRFGAEYRRTVPVRESRNALVVFSGPLRTSWEQQNEVNYYILPACSSPVDSLQ